MINENLKLFFFFTLLNNELAAAAAAVSKISLSSSFIILEVYKHYAKLIAFENEEREEIKVKNQNSNRVEQID
jgi:hypothetical protein